LKSFFGWAPRLIGDCGSNTPRVAVPGTATLFLFIPRKTRKPEQRERILFAKQREDSLLIFQDSGLVLLDGLLIRFDLTLIGHNRFLIPENTLLVCNDVSLGHL
jgi:hypothetical protein